MAKPSYEGLTTKELKVLLRQGARNRHGILCELGHDDGCTTELSQEGKAPCLAEVVNELRWRSAPTETVEVE